MWKASVAVKCAAETLQEIQMSTPAAEKRTEECPSKFIIAFFEVKEDWYSIVQLLQLTQVFNYSIYNCKQKQKKHSQLINACEFFTCQDQLNLIAHLRKH